MSEVRTSRESVEATIVAFIRDELGETGVDDLDADDNLLTSGFVDSVGVMRLIASMEERLAVKVPPTELVPANFRTVRVMAGFLLGLKKAD